MDVLCSGGGSVDQSDSPAPISSETDMRGSASSSIDTDTSVCGRGHSFPLIASPAPPLSQFSYSNTSALVSCSGAAAAPGLGTEAPMGLPLSHERHVFLCYKDAATWPSELSCVEWDRLPRALRAVMRAARGHMGKEALLTVCEGRDGLGSYNGDALVFPDMVVYRGLTHFDVDCFVKEALVEEEERLLRPEPLTGCHVFVCCHRSRSTPCGQVGPQVVARFQAEIAARGLEGRVFVRGCCHLGGSGWQCCGNVAIFRRPHEFSALAGSPNAVSPPDSADGASGNDTWASSSEGSAAPLHGAALGGDDVAGEEPRGDWYGRVAPDDVAELLEEHVLRGRVIERLWLGQMAASWQPLSPSSRRTSSSDDGEAGASPVAGRQVAIREGDTRKGELSSSARRMEEMGKGVPARCTNARCEAPVPKCNATATTTRQKVHCWLTGGTFPVHRLESRADGDYFIISVPAAEAPAAGDATWRSRLADAARWRPPCWRSTVQGFVSGLEKDDIPAAVSVAVAAAAVAAAFALSRGAASA